MFKYFFMSLNLLLLKAFAESELYKNNEDIKEALSQNMYEPNYFSLFLGLGFVIVLVYFTGFLYQKLIKVKLGSDSEEINKIEILSTSSLGQGKNLHVIKVNGFYSLIGSTAHNITHIKDFTENDIKNFLKEQNGKNC